VAAIRGDRREGTMPESRESRLCILVAVLGVLVPALPARATTYTVNSTLDQPDADTADNVCSSFPAGLCTLRAAVMQANAHAGPDVILLPAGTYVITRVGTDSIASVGDLDVTDDLTIQAVGGTVTIDANGAVTSDRAFKLLSGSLFLEGITITGGNTAGSGGAIFAQGRGGLTLTNVTITGNTAGQGGGGVYATCATIQITSSVVQGNTNLGPGGGGGVNVEFDISGIVPIFPALTVSGSSFLNNTSLATGLAGGLGGGLLVANSSATISGSTFQGNSALQGGGFVYAPSQCTICSLTLTTSLFEGNSALGFGGGAHLESGPLSVSNSRFVGNSASSGAGLSTYGAATFTDVEVSRNTATGHGGGIYALRGLTPLNVIRGWIDGNTAALGGGIYSEEGALAGLVILTDTNVLNNTASDGGGIWVGTSLAARTSAIYANHATRGGGVFVSGSGVHGTTTFDDGTISGNSAGSYGGGVYVDASATVKLSSATIARNRARTSFPSAGGGGGVYVAAGGSLTATASVFSFNSNAGVLISYSDCLGTLSSGGYDFLSTNAGCTISGVTTGNQVGGVYPSILDPQLGGLAWLGNQGAGPNPPASSTPAHLPAATSPLVNAGPPGGCVDSSGVTLPADQIGQARSTAGGCDIGAVETGAVAAGAKFYPLPPCRLFDTRNSTGPDAAAPALGALETRNFALQERCNVPDSARAISVNVTVTGAVAAGFLTLFPADLAAVPGTSNGNFKAGQTRANNAMVSLAADSSGFDVLNGANGTVHFILDVNGYFR
jgi:predicted outer membrane repeat protein